MEIELCKKENSKNSWFKVLEFEKWNCEYYENNKVNVIIL